MASKVIWSDRLRERLEREIRDVILESAQPIIHEAVEKVRKRLHDQVGIVAVRMAREFSIEELADRLIITVRIKEGESDG